MNNQEKLNSMSLEEASVYISECLINERLALQNKYKELESLKAKYQEDYLIANADGDRRENAPLEKAIENLKVNDGDLQKVGSKSKSLDNIEDVMYLSATYDYDILVDLLTHMKDEDLKLIYVNLGVSSTADFVQSLKDGDEDYIKKCINEFDMCYGKKMVEAIIQDVGRENVKFTDSKWIEDKETSLRKSGKALAEYRTLMEIYNILEIKEVRPYNNCGIITMYSTVRLRLDGTVMTYKIYPKGLSFIDIGVIAADSRVASAIMGKRLGDRISIQHLAKDVMQEYEIIGLY